MPENIKIIKIVKHIQRSRIYPKKLPIIKVNVPIHVFKLDGEK